MRYSFDQQIFKKHAKLQSRTDRGKYGNYILYMADKLLTEISLWSTSFNIALIHNAHSVRLFEICIACMHFVSTITYPFKKLLNKHALCVSIRLNSKQSA